MRLPRLGARCSGPVGVTLLAKLVQQNLGDGIQGGENILAGAGDDFEALHTFLSIIQDVIEIVDGCDVRKVTLVVLQDIGEVVERHVLLGQVILEIFKTLDVLFHLFPLRIGYEHDAIDAAQDQLASSIVNDLTGDGVELKLGDKAFDNQSVERKKVEEKGAIGGSSERDKVATVLRVNALVDVAEVSGLAAQRRTVINDLKLNLAAGVIND
jgi:hypothetical protein